MLLAVLHVLFGNVGNVLLVLYCEFVHCTVHVVYGM